MSGIVSIGMPHLTDKKRVSRLNSFAEYVSILPWFNVDVLHKLYINIYVPKNTIEDNYAERSLTCADIILSPVVTPIHHNAFMFKPEILGQLRMAVQRDKPLMRSVAEFMWSYSIECREHFIAQPYLEAFQIEANFIINPGAETDRITQRLINTFNQVPDMQSKMSSIGYYLNILERDNLPAELQSIVDTFDMLQHYDPATGEVPEGLDVLTDQTPENDQAVAIRLPLDVAQPILAGISKEIDASVGTKSLYVIAVGIDRYQSPEIHSLDGAVTDAKRISDFLENNHKENIGFKLFRYQNATATRKSIIQAIDVAKKKLKRGDTFVFYFAGYGGIESDDSMDSGGMTTQQSANIFGNISPPSEARFLVLHDTNISDGLTAKGKTQSAMSYGLSLEELEYLLSTLEKGVQCVIILDCGFERQMLLKITGDPNVRSLANPVHQRPGDAYIWGDTHIELKYDAVIMYASSHGENTYETTAGGRFTQGLCEALHKVNNHITYADLISGPNSITFPDTMQSPLIETVGSGSAQESFLHGLLITENTKVSQRIAKAIESGGKELDLSGLKLTHLPQEVFELASLKTLDISKNHLTSIPAEIEKLSQLSTLIAHGNPITEIHENIAQLTELKTVILYQCNFEIFPKAILECKLLKNLQLEGNQIKWIPPTIRELTDLQQLDIRNNPILNLPHELLQSSARQLEDYYSAWELLPESNDPFVVIIGMDYEQKLRNVEAELTVVHRILSGKEIRCLDLYNPDSIDLFRTIYQHQNVISVLHFAAYHINHIIDPNASLVKLTDKDIVEMFRCIRREKFNTNLIILNSCETEGLTENLLDGIFDTIVSVKEKVSDKLALEFSREIYSDLIENIALFDAFENTKKKFID